MNKIKNNYLLNLRLGLLFIFIFLSINLTYSQTNDLIYEDIVQLNTNHSKGEIFMKARKWINDNFNDSKEVLTIQDKESGELSGNCTFKYNSSINKGALVTSGYVYFKLNIEVKDGKYKYKFFNFKHNGTKGKNGPAVNFENLTLDETYPNSPPPSGYGFNSKWCNSVWNDIKSQTEIKISMLIKSLMESMQKQETW